MRELTQDEYSAVIDALNTDESTCGGLYRNYVPRGILGKPCFGVIFEVDTQLYTFLVNLTRELDDQVRSGTERVYATLPSELAESLRTDTLGKSYVAYFPGFTLPEVDV
jgi:hypothetical protein